MCLLQAPRGENRGYTGETRARGTKVNTIFQVTRNGRTIEAEDGGSDAGEEAQPGTQGNHITSRIVKFSPLVLFLCTLSILYITFSGILRSVPLEERFISFSRYAFITHRSRLQISVELMISDTVEKQ